MKHEAFYATAATVIPVLYLVLVFQTRSWSVQRSHRRWVTTFWTVFVSALLIWAIFAEVEAFHALEHLTDRPWRRTVISTSIISMLGGVLWVGLETALSQRSDTERAQREENSQA